MTTAEMIEQAYQAMKRGEISLEDFEALVLGLTAKPPVMRPHQERQTAQEQR